MAQVLEQALGHFADGGAEWGAACIAVHMGKAGAAYLNLYRGCL